MCIQLVTKYIDIHDNANKYVWKDYLPNKITVLILAYKPIP